MGDAILSAFASEVFKNLWDPVFNVIGDEIQKMKDMDVALRKLEICIEEALDLLPRVNSSHRREADKLAYYCHEADDLIEVIEHEIKKRHILISPKNWAKPHKLDELQKKMAGIIDGLREHVDLSQQIQPSTSVSNTNRRLQLIGREQDVQFIIEELIHREKHDSNGVSIVGMRGVGKTALAVHILNHEDVQAKFPLILRASMSGNNFCVEDMFSRLVVVYSQTRLNSGKRFKVENIESHLLHCDQWLIMLDSLGEVPSIVWRDFQTSYLTPGRKLLITTFNPRVGRMARTTVHYLKPLSETHCQGLIRNEFMLSRNSFVPWSSVSSDLASKCYGLPLVAQFLVWSLPDIVEDQRFLHEDLWKWPGFVKDILPVLKSSSMGLDSKLRRCFSYFSLFPHNYHFCREDMIHLWIGERLVRPHALRFENNGLAIFNELLERSIIQPQTVNNHGLMRYEIHKFTHDFAQIPDSKTFVCMDAECTSSPYHCYKYTCHLSLSCNKHLHLQHWDEIKEQLGRLRTLLLLHDHQQSGLISNLPDDFFKKVSKLRVLALNRANITDLPRSIYKLKHLRFLDISDTNIRKLPEKFANLSTLQILKLKVGPEIPQLPMNFSMLTNLSFVDWNECHLQKMEAMLRNIGNLVNLQTLPLFAVGNKKGYRITELKSMNYIQGSIKITKLQNVTDEAEAREAMLSHKSFLRRLEFVWTKKASNAEGVLLGLQPHNQVNELKLVGYSGATFPRWLSHSITKLHKLELVGCQFCNKIPTVGQLPYLKTLHLEKMSSLVYLNPKLCGAPINGFGYFHSLESLVLHDMVELQELEGLEANVMSCLRELRILNCPKLKILPSLCHLISLVDLEIKECSSLSSIPDLPTSLKSLTIRDCDLVKRRCLDGDESRCLDWSKIKNVSEVLVDGVKIHTSACEHNPFPNAERHNTYLQGFQYIVQGVKSIIVNQLF